MSAIPFPTGAARHRKGRASKALVTGGGGTAARESPPTLTVGERILVRQENVVGTDTAVHVNRDDLWHRIPFTDVDMALWDSAASRLVVRLWTDGGSGTSVRVPGDRRFASFVNERVTSTQV